jgi:hypothetical protein
VAKPEVEIDVEPASGRWLVDGFAMILVPQHFFMNNHFAMEDALGAEKLAGILAPAGRESAYTWCKGQAERYGLEGEQVFAHYMKRLSQRGWAQFRVLSVDAAAGCATVRVDHSSFVTGSRQACGRRVCYVFGPWLKGAMEFVADNAGGSLTLVGKEKQCVAEGHQHCLFEVAPQ